MRLTDVAGRSLGNIKIYTLSTCGWCKKTKNFLNNHNVAYSYIDVDLVPEDERDQVVREQKKFNPAGSYPTIVLDNGRTIIGFDEPSLLKLVGADKHDG